MSHADERGDLVFAIEHTIEIDGTPEDVWTVLVDFGAYPDWNPYVLTLEGDASIGGRPRVTITQENWPDPITVEPLIIRAEAGRVLHWRGEVGRPGIFDTDHSFEIQPLAPGRVRFVQREEFRGSHAENVDLLARGYTEAAFRAMNEALAERVASGARTSAASAPT